MQNTGTSLMASEYTKLLCMNEKERDLHFLRTAFQVANFFSQDANTQTGAIIVDPDFNIISVGSNRVNFGDPRRYEGRGERIILERPEKYEALIHAERDVHYGANRLGKPVVGCTLYTTWVPCDPCAEITVNNGIKRYVTHQCTTDWYDEALKDDSKRIDWQGSIDEAVNRFKKSRVEYICLSDKIGGVKFLFDDKIREP